MGGRCGGCVSRVLAPGTFTILNFPVDEIEAAVLRYMILI